MEPFTDPTPWLDPISGERYPSLPTDDNGHPIQGFVLLPRENVADDNQVDTPGNN